MSKPTDAAVPESHRQFGDLARAGGMPHRGEQAGHPDRMCRPRAAAAVRRPGNRRACARRPRRGSGRVRDAARARSGPRRTRRRRRPDPRRIRGPPGAGPPGSASPRRCARTFPDSAPAIRCRRRRGTSAPSDSASVGGQFVVSALARPAPARSRGGVRRRDGRADTALGAWRIEARVRGIGPVMCRR